MSRNEFAGPGWPKEPLSDADAGDGTPLGPADGVAATLRAMRRKLARLAPPAAPVAAETGCPAADAVPPGGILDRLRRRLARPADSGPAATPWLSEAGLGPPISLDEALKGSPVPAPHGGLAYVVTSPLPDSEKSLRDLPRRLRDSIAELPGPEPLKPEDLLFMDLETTGLGSTPLFLIGTIVCEEDQLLIRQYLARDYDEEGPAISLFLEAAATKKLLVTFNGLTYDVPFLRMRAAANRVPCTLHFAHLDLLREARRIWRGTLPNFRLQTLERLICGRQRQGDLPGHEVPGAYMQFLRTDDARHIVPVVEHNRLDLVTMADLFTRLLG